MAPFSKDVTEVAAPTTVLFSTVNDPVRLAAFSPILEIKVPFTVACPLMLATI